MQLTVPYLRQTRSQVIEALTESFQGLRGGTNVDSTAAISSLREAAQEINTLNSLH